MKRAGLTWTHALTFAAIVGAGLTLPMISFSDEPAKKAEEAAGPNPEKPGPPDRPEKRGDGPRGEHRPPHGPELMRVLDTDKDGKISRDELAKAAEKFNELDEDRDGQLDMHELMGPPPGGREDVADRMEGRREEGRRGRFGRGPGRPDFGGEGGPRRPRPEGPDGEKFDGPRDRPPFEGRGERGERGEGGPPRRGAGGPGGRSVEDVVHRMFEALDGNNDGKLTAEEAPPKIKERFAKIDENGDGTIDEPELCKIGMMGKRMGGGRDRDGDRPRKNRPNDDAPEKPADAPEKPADAPATK